MILVDWQIKEQMEKGALEIDPIDLKQIGPASIDLTLSDMKIKFYPKKPLGSMRNIETLPLHQLVSGPVHDLRPKEFALFSTVETVTLGKNIVGRLEGRSSIGRQGIFIHNAGFIDPGFNGQITLELFNATDDIILIPAGMKICQLVLESCEAPDVSYNERQGSKYCGQKFVTMSKLEEELNNDWD